MLVLLYFILVIVFYGFSNNYGFYFKPNKVKVITTLIFTTIIFPCLFIVNC